MDDVVVNTMEYDGYGNIQKKNGKIYTYDDVWRDKLTAYDGQAITYDAQGNPVSYLGHTLTWEKGRQLMSFDSNTYTYNANGIRTSKTINGVKHTYTLDGTKILMESWPEVGEDNVEHTRVLKPLYDNEENVCGILYGDIPYYFLKNLQGDIIAITNQNGVTLVRYAYDAWGACTIIEDNSNCSISTINPFRYRGYYYDAEIGMYYLQSRYYGPKLGRFLNSDDPIFAVTNINSMKTNLFTYCLNELVNLSDASGTDAIWLQATESVFKMGHTGLLFQVNLNWYYWYWGANLTAAIIRAIAEYIKYRLWTAAGIITASVFLPALVKLQNICDNQINSTNYKGRALSKANALYNSKTKFNRCFYIKGNFGKTYNYFAALRSSKNYSLLLNNCMQTTVDGLRKGSFSSNHSKNISRLKNARARTVPNLAYNYMKQFF